MRRARAKQQRNAFPAGRFALGVLCAAAIRVASGEGWEFTEAERSHWAFQPVVRTEAPPTRSPELVRNPIDSFLLARLEAKGLTYSEPASRHELLRRATFDLIGLPPTRAEIEAFVADDSLDAYERLVERLLASPHYGERWGRHWLDLVRFAETAGFNADPHRPLAYLYRDYVIRAFNADMPYDRFVTEQIAGDEVAPHDPAAIVATGYNVMWPDESNASNVLLARQDALNDLTGNFGAVFLGLTIGCAQCHDHKFDPILQSDFYKLQAFFAGVVPKDEVAAGAVDELRAYREARGRWHADTQSLRDELHAIESAARAKAGHVKRLKFPKVVLDAIDTAPEKRSPFQQQLVFWSERQIVLTDEQIAKQLSDADKARREELRDALGELKKQQPKPPRTIEAMAGVEVAQQPPETWLLATGSYDYPIEEVQPDVLEILDDDPAAPMPIPAASGQTSGRRTALARWVTDPANPLTARVMVNRLWQEHFGRGLVETANDFGTLAPPPSHPELLDWLASEFISSGWSIKHIHRLIVTSNAYRQSTRRANSAPAGASIDPDNALYWHFPRQRLTGEAMRDAMLAAAGQLNESMYGPGVRPELPPDFTGRGGWKVEEVAGARNRRSVYIFAKRNLPYPLLQAFDFPDMHESCARRPETTVAPQALMLVNSELILENARGIAARLISEHAGDFDAIVADAWYATLGRSPLASEAAEALAFLESQCALLQDEGRTPEALGIVESLTDGADPATFAAVADLCHVLLNSNEFMYLD